MQNYYGHLIMKDDDGCKYDIGFEFHNPHFSFIGKEVYFDSLIGIPSKNWLS